MKRYKEKFHVYTLRRNGIPFYVGVTIHPATRASQHRTSSTHVGQYIRGLNCCQGELTLVVENVFSNYHRASIREQNLIKSLPGLINRKQGRRPKIQIAIVN